MNTRLFGVVVRVHNLDVCRDFYRNVLNLGDPVMDSNCWVEFELQDHSALCLELIEDEEERTQPAHSPISWVFTINNLDEFLNRMTAYGYPADSRDATLLGFELKCFHDPEGNPFYVSAPRMA